MELELLIDKIIDKCTDVSGMLSDQVVPIALCRELIEERRLDEAIRYCIQSLRMQQSNAEVYCLLSDACQRAGMEEEALDVLRASVPYLRSPDDFLAIGEKWLSCDLPDEDGALFTNDVVVHVLVDNVETYELHQLRVDRLILLKEQPYVQCLPNDEWKKGFYLLEFDELDLAHLTFQNALGNVVDREQRSALFYGLGQTLLRKGARDVNQNVIRMGICQLQESLDQKETPYTMYMKAGGHRLLASMDVSDANAQAESAIKFYSVLECGEHYVSESRQALQELQAGLESPLRK